MRTKKKNKGIYIAVIVGMYVLYYTKDVKYAAATIAICSGIKPLLGAVIKRIRHKQRKRKYLRSDISKIDKMSGHEFEEYLQYYFEKKGYKCKNVGQNGHDYGVDLIIKKNGVAVAVQAKRYNSSVGIKAIQEVIAGANFYHCDQKLVVTNSTYTAAARKMANECNVQLIDRNQLYRFKQL